MKKIIDVLIEYDDIIAVIFMISTSMVMMEYIAFETITGIDLAKHIIYFSIMAILMSVIVYLNYSHDADPKE